MLKFHYWNFLDLDCSVSVNVFLSLDRYHNVLVSICILSPFLYSRLSNFFLSKKRRISLISTLLWGFECCKKKIARIHIWFNVVIMFCFWSCGIIYSFAMFMHDCKFLSEYRWECQVDKWLQKHGSNIYFDKVQLGFSVFCSAPPKWVYLLWS